MPGTLGSYLETRQSFKIEGDRICADHKDLQVDIRGPVTPAAKSAIKVARNSIERKGVLCETFYRAEGGGYVYESLDRSGKRAGPDTHVTFFADSKPLRTQP